MLEPPGKRKRKKPKPNPLPRKLRRIKTKINKQKSKARQKYTSLFCSTIISPPREEGPGEVNNMITRGAKSGSKDTTKIRQRLRRNLTLAEEIFWNQVSKSKFMNLKFRRQHGIGKYIEDFNCPPKKLIIEIDGNSHFTKQGQLRDAERSRYIASLGYRIIRYNNNDIVDNVDGVFQDLENQLKLTPSNSPSRGGE